MPIWAWFRCLGGGRHTPNIENMPPRHGFDVQHVGDGGHAPNIENKPRRACFRCSAEGEVVEQRRTLKPCPNGMVSAFGTWRSGGEAPNIEIVPIWEVMEKQTLKPCPDGMVSDVRKWWRSAKYRNHAHLGIVSMFGGWGGGGQAPNSETRPSGVFQCSAAVGKKRPPSVSRFERGRG